MPAPDQNPGVVAPILEKKYRGGVLIIGSLYWDPDRQAWRTANLSSDTTKQRLVPSPIRYGKITASRNHIFTMVFSKDCDNYRDMGTARFVPFNSELTLAGLHQQALALSRAEQKKQAVDENNYYWSWGTLVICINPNLPDDDKKAIADSWKSKFDPADKNTSKYHHREEKNAVLPGGFLDMQWPAELYDADFFLATAIQPNVAAYPKAGDLAALMKVPEQKEYFDKNVEAGIRTFQDQVVFAHLKNKGVQRENLHLLIYSLIVGSVLGTFIYDFYDVIMLALQTPGENFLHDHLNIIVLKGSMFVGCLIFYVSDYLNTIFVMGRRQTRLLIDIVLLVITGLTFKSINLKSEKDPAINVISLCYFLFMIYYMFIHWIDRKGKHEFYRNLFAAEVVFALLFGLILVHCFFGLLPHPYAYWDVYTWQWITAGAMIASSVTYAAFVWRRWDEDFAG